MGLALDTVLVASLNPGAGPTAGTVTASGDSLAVRAFDQPASCYLENITRMGTTAGFVQVRSPRMHDNNQGIRITPGESPSAYSLPAQAAQKLYSTDTLIVELSGGAAETDVAALHLGYDNLGGVAARLRSWGDISGNIANYKPVRIAVTSSAVVGAWQDTAINATEDLLHADTDYAVLGYSTNTALAVVGVKGVDTGNLRVCGPGATQEFPTTEWFIRIGEKTGRPHIPVINSNNKAGAFVSVAAATASVAAVVELILVQLVAKVGS